MRLFWIVALLHGYIGWRVTPALPHGQALFALLLLANAVLVPLAFAGRRLHDRVLADRITWAGTLAMGLFSMLLVLTLLRDAALLLALPFDWPRLGPASAAAVPLLALAASAAGFAGARRTPRVREVEIPIDGLPPALDGFSIAQISDLHVGPTVKRDWVQAIVDKVNQLQPDAVAVTGDLVDGRPDELRADVQPLAGLRSRHGTFFVTGNHEYYSGAAEWIALLRGFGWRVLIDEHAVLGHDGARVVIAGVADYSARHFVATHRSDPQAAMAGAPADAAVRVLLAHQPRSAPAAADAGFDVQLSGHTHGGQFWPWNLFVPLQQPYTAGLHRLKQLWVYTSRGTGYWGPPLRLGAPSEITRVVLRTTPAPRP